MNIQFVQVPPPKKAPVQSLAASLGLIDGLRAEKVRGDFRCVRCNNMRRNWLVWVPDGITRRDRGWMVTEACRVSAHNGLSGGWCLACARKLGRRTHKFCPAIVFAVAGMLLLFGLLLLFVGYGQP
jgi:hypothetical protein